MNVELLDLNFNLNAALENVGWKPSLTSKNVGRKSDSATELIEIKNTPTP